MSSKTIRSLARKARNLAPRLSARALAQVVLPFSVALAVVLNVGPSFQYYVYSLIGNSSPSIYDSAYAEGIAKFPSLGEWLSSLDAGLTLIAFFAAAVGFSARSVAQAPARVAIVTASCLLLMDAAVMLLHGTLSVENIAKNSIADVAGGVLLYVFAAITIFIFRVSRAHANGTLLKSIVPATAVVVVAVSLSMSVYYIFFFFYQPVPVKFSFTVSPPVSGYIAPDEGGGDRRAGDVFHPYDLVTADPIGGYLHMTSPRGTLRVNWRESKLAESYDVDLFLMADCMGEQGIGEIRPQLGPPAAHVSGIRQLSVTTDDGFTNLTSGEYTDNRYAVFAKRPTSYWVKKGEGEEITLSWFISPNDIIHQAHGGQSEFYLDVFLRAFGNKRGPAGRLVTINADGKIFKLFFEPSALDAKAAMQCRSYPSHLQFGATTLAAHAFAPGVFIRLTPKSASLEQALQSTEISFFNANGWLELSKIKSSLVEGKSYRTRMLSVAKGVTYQEIDGRKVDISPNESVVAFGDIGIEFVTGGAYKVSGKASMMWRGNSRVNQTKWENLTNEQQVFILGILTTMLVALFRIGRSSFTRRAFDDRTTVENLVSS